MWVLQEVGEGLRDRGLAVTRTPVGWFNAVGIRVKGHSLSRMFRVISAEAATP